jgi:mono/diheme cytochrome c family protein
VIQPPRSRAAAPPPLRRAALPILLLTALACNERPSDVREWRAADHDHTENPGRDQVQVDPKDAGAPAVPGLEEVTIVAWQQNCTQCHGQLGRGDGPRGPMLKATNLSDPTWQSSVTDEQIAATIKLGKGAMPAFKLPDVTIANLTRLVRMMNVARLQAAAAAASASAGGVPSAAAPSARPEVGKPAAPPKPSGSAVVSKPSPSGAPPPSPPSPQ